MQGSQTTPSGLVRLHYAPAFMEKQSAFWNALSRGVNPVRPAVLVVLSWVNSRASAPSTQVLGGWCTRTTPASQTDAKLADTPIIPATQ
jgi:hypothetical protein